MKYNIIIKAKSGETNCPTKKLNKLNNIDCQDNFAEYSDFSDKLECGYMSFIVENGELYTITSFTAIEDFNEDELHDLVEETRGQWSDGIGEGFEQYPCCEIDGEEIFISPYNGKVEVEVIKTPINNAKYKAY